MRPDDGRARDELTVVDCFDPRFTWILHASVPAPPDIFDGDFTYLNRNLVASEDEIARCRVHSRHSRVGLMHARLAMRDGHL